MVDVRLVNTCKSKLIPPNTDPSERFPLMDSAKGDETKFRAFTTRIRFSLWPDGACAIRDKIN